MVATDSENTRSFSLTEKGQAFLVIIKEILASPFVKECLCYTDACKEAVSKLESGRIMGIESPDSQFLLLYSNLRNNMLAIPCEEILATNHKKILAKARILLRVRDAMWLYPLETNTNRQHPFFKWNLSNG